MRAIRYLSISLALLVGIIWAAANAAPGNVRYALTQSETIVLTGPQKLLARSLAQSVFPSLLTGDIERLSCWQDRSGKWSCMASEDSSTISDDDFALLVFTDQIKSLDQKTHRRKRFVDLDALASIDTFTRGVWGLDRQQVWSLVLTRSGVDVLASYSLIKIASKSNFRGDWNNGQVAIPLDILTE